MHMAVDVALGMYLVHGMSFLNTFFGEAIDYSLLVAIWQERGTIRLHQW